MVLVDGRIVATWGHSLEKDRLRVTVEKISPFPRSVLAGIREEVYDLARFLNADDVDLKVH